MAWLVESARWEDARLMSLFGGTTEGPPTPRKGEAERLENDSEGVVGCMEDDGLPFNDEMVEMRFNHDDDLLGWSRSLLSSKGDASGSAFNVSDRRALTELRREFDGVEVWNGDELPDILRQKLGLRPVPCDVDALGRSRLASNLGGFECAMWGVA